MRHSLIALLCLLLVIPTFAQEDACLAKNGNLNEETGQCELVTNIEVNMVYPLDLATDYPLIETAVDDYYTTIRSQFLAFATSDFMPGVTVPWALDMDYEVFEASDNVISVAFTRYEYTGGAHGNTYIDTMTFDLSENRELTLPELFINQDVPLEVLSQKAREQVTAVLGEDAVFEEGFAPELENFQDWVLTREGLTVYFEPYQVAPYAAGVQQFTIPLVDLVDVLAI